MKPFVPYSRWTRKAFNRYLGWNFKRNFENIFTLGLSSLEKIETPLLFVSNHVSWWDGFFLFEVQRRIRPQGKIFTIALEKTCFENPILPRMGVLPICPGNLASLRALLKHLQKLRAENQSGELVVSFFPQGKIMPSFCSSLGFQSGIEKVISALTPVTVVPIGIHIEPMTGKKPTAILSIGTPRPCSEMTEVEEVEKSVQEALSKIHQGLFINGERLPEGFERWSL